MCTNTAIPKRFSLKKMMSRLLLNKNKIRLNTRHSLKRSNPMMIDDLIVFGFVNEQSIYDVPIDIVFIMLSYFKTKESFSIEFGNHYMCINSAHDDIILKSSVNQFLYGQSIISNDINKLKPYMVQMKFTNYHLIDHLEIGLINIKQLKLSQCPTQNWRSNDISYFEFFNSTKDLDVITYVRNMFEKYKEYCPYCPVKLTNDVITIKCDFNKAGWYAVLECFFGEAQDMRNVMIEKCKPNFDSFEGVKGKFVPYKCKLLKGKKYRLFMNVYPVESLVNLGDIQVSIL